MRAELARLRTAVEASLNTPPAEVEWPCAIRHAAEYCGCCVATVRRAYHRGALKAERTERGRLRFHKDDLDEWLSR